MEDPKPIPVWEWWLFLAITSVIWVPLLIILSVACIILDVSTALVDYLLRVMQREVAS